jgi:hypothetical protein
MGNIKLMMLLHETINEIGDLQNIEPYKTIKPNPRSYYFSAKINDKDQNVKVNFENVSDNASFFKVNSQIYKDSLAKTDLGKNGLYNLGFSIDNITSQFDKTNLSDYFRIMKTVLVSSYDFLEKKQPFGIMFFGANKKGEAGIDRQKTLLYFKIAAKNLPKGYRMEEVTYGADKGYIIYKDQ